MKKNNKGFTLIELLAVIVVLSIVLGLTAYIAINAIANAKEKSYQVTINNIENNAGNYLTENSDKLFFISTSDGENEYQCVTIKELIELGYLKDDVTDSQIDKDGAKVNLNNYVYLERNTNSKAITRTHYDPDSEINSTCTLATNAVGNIQVLINPSNNNWSQTKKIKVYYKVKNVSFEKIGNFKYTYRFENEDGNAINLNGACTSGCNDDNNIKEFKVSATEVYLHAYLKEDDNIIAEVVKKIDKIDNIKPQIELLNYEKDEATGIVKARLRVFDEISGVNHNKNEKTFTKSQIIVKKDSTIIDSNKLALTLNNETNTTAIYEITINESITNGVISISIPESKIYDNALNASEAKSFNININSTGKVNIKYDMNNGTWQTHGAAYSNNGSIITKNGNEVFHTIAYGKSLGTDGLYNWNNSQHINLKREGYYVRKGEEWCTSSGRCYSQDENYPASSFCDASAGDCTVTLYANWESKPIRIYYHQNGGSISGYCRAGSGDKKPCVNRNGWAAICEKDSCPNTTGLTYAYQECTSGSTCDLLDYNNQNFLNITRKNYFATKTKEWCTDSRGNGTCFDHDPSEDYTYDYLKTYKTAEQDEYYELSLYVNWESKPIRIFFNTNGGTMSGTGYSTTSSGWVTTTINEYIYTIGSTKYASQKCELGSSCNVWNNRETSGWSFSKSGYGPKVGEEWLVRKKTSDGHNYTTKLNQETNYTYNQMVYFAESEKDDYYEVNLYVNWDSSSCSIKFTNSGFKYKVNGTQYNAETTINVPCNTDATIEAISPGCGTRFDWWLGSPIDGDKSNPKTFNVTGNIILSVSDWNGCGNSNASGTGTCGFCIKDSDCRSGTCSGTCANSNGSYKCCILSDGSMCN